MRTLLFRKASAKFADIWHVIGLRGTGSDSYTVADLFVPESHTVLREAEPKLRQPHRLDGRPVLSGEVDKRLTPPERERGVVRLDRAVGVAGPATGLDEAGEPMYVDSVGLDVEPVAGAVATEDVGCAEGSQGAAQLRHP